MPSVVRNDSAWSALTPPKSLSDSAKEAHRRLTDRGGAKYPYFFWNILF